jgi:hypothetical protein
MTEDDRIPDMAATLYRERVRRARLMSPEQKILSGGDLFDAVRERMIVGIRSQFPHFSEEQVQAEYLRRLSLSRRLERARSEGAS